MSIIRWRPFGALDDFFEDVPLHMFQLETCDLATDVSEDADAVLVEMHIPGMDPDHIDIRVENNHLHVSGNRKEEQEIEDRTYYQKEIRRGSFERVVTLPCSVHVSEAQATFKDGLLRIYLPKKEEQNSQSIKVKKS